MKTLRELLKEAGVGQKTVADALNIHITHLGRFDDLRKRSVEEVEIISKATGLTIDKLVGWRAGPCVEGEVKATNGPVGQINGGTYNFNSGIPEIASIAAQKEHTANCYATLRAELAIFHEKIKEKDAYINQVTENSYKRNDEHLKRLDRKDDQIAQLTERVLELSHSVQERADKIVERGLKSLKTD